jgi:hypothetical protein
MQKSEAIDQLAAALALAQAEIKTPVKNKTATVPMKAGGQYSYTYADLADVLAAIHPPLSKHGLSITNTVSNGERIDVLECTLMHKSGQWISSSYPITPGQRPQDLGSFLTYLKRYLVSGLVSVSSEDDDDAAAAQAAAAKTAPARQDGASMHRPPAQKQAAPAGKQAAAAPPAQDKDPQLYELDLLRRRREWKGADFLAFVKAKYSKERISLLTDVEIKELSGIVETMAAAEAVAKYCQPEPGSEG